LPTRDNGTCVLITSCNGGRSRDVRHTEWNCCRRSCGPRAQLPRVVLAPTVNCSTRDDCATMESAGCHGCCTGNTRNCQPRVGIGRTRLAGLKETVVTPATNTAIGDDSTGMTPPSADLRCVRHPADQNGNIATEESDGLPKLTFAVIPPAVDRTVDHGTGKRSPKAQATSRRSACGRGITCIRVERAHGETERDCDGTDDGDETCLQH
jgi:hypothetical protein